MKIIGYSERGAMNALFYGMAHDNNDDEMRKLIKLAKNEGKTIDGTFQNFRLYSEFSLSEFGDPDMMIIATNEEGKDVVFFIEAKASCCKYYNIKDQKNYHDGEDNLKGFLTTGGHENGHSSNLFFQLRLKHYFFKIRSYLFDNEKINELDNQQNNFFKEVENGFSKYSEKQLNRFKLGRKGNRKIGENVVVERMVGRIKHCETAYYIAIIPKQKTNENVNTSGYGFNTYTITWEDIFSNFEKYVGETIRFNQNENRDKKKNKVFSQILNYPI